MLDRVMRSQKEVMLVCNIVLYLMIMCVSITGFASDKDSKKRKYNESSGISGDVLRRTLLHVRAAMILRVTKIVPDVVSLIMQYDSLPFVRWIPIIDEQDQSYQYNRHKAELLRSSMLDFTYFVTGKCGLKITRLGYRDDRDDRMQNSDEERDILAAIQQKSKAALTQPHYIASIDWNVHQHDMEYERTYSMHTNTVSRLTYLLDCFDIAWISPDSAAYRRAIQRSLLLLSKEVSLVDIGKEMDVVYSKSAKHVSAYMENYNRRNERCRGGMTHYTYVTQANDMRTRIERHNETVIDHDIRDMQRYIERYQSSSVPRFLKQAENYEGLVPVLYRLSSYNRNQKSRTVF